MRSDDRRQASGRSRQKDADDGGDRPAVCIVRHNYYPDSHVRRDAEALVRAGYAVHVVALRRPNQPAREIMHGVEVHRLPVEHRRGGVLRYAWEYVSFALLALLKVATLHLRRCFRVVEVDNMPDLLVFSALVPKLMGTPIILHIFDTMPELLAHIRKLSARHSLVRLLALFERVSTSFADFVLVTQDAARQAVLRRGVPAKKVGVVLNSADEAIFRPRAPRTATAGETFEIITHGAMLERYGIQVLIDAMPVVLAAVPEARLQVFGEGEYRAALEARARKRGVTDRVVFRGYTPLGELLDALARADVGYAGMLCDLMLSNKLVEYVAVGVPAVAANWPTFAHYFPADTVSYFSPGDADGLAAAIIGLARDPARAHEQAARATVRYQSYRWSVQQEVYLDFYRDLLDGVRGRAAATTEEPAP